MNVKTEVFSLLSVRVARPLLLERVGIGHRQRECMHVRFVHRAHTVSARHFKRQRGRGFFFRASAAADFPWRNK